MTHEEKLQAVTADIRKQLPRLMKLEKGCLLRMKISNIIGEIIGVGSKENYIVLGEDEVIPDYYLKKNLYIYKIIGKEPMLTDVLEWLNILNVKAEITDRGMLYAIKKDNIPMRDYISVKIDLSKPYLKDQSEELINFLYKFLN